MRKRFLLISSFTLVALLALLNLIALKFYLYWPKNGLFGFDTLMHFLGGLALGVLVVWFFNPANKKIFSFLTIFIAAMMLGIVWEIFEYIYDIAVISPEKYLIDTTHDLIMDALGVVTAWFLTAPSSQTQESF